MGRPRDVTVIAVYQFIVASLFTAGGFAAIGFGLYTARKSMDSLGYDLGGFVVVFGAISIIFGLLQGVAALGLWNLKSWGPALTQVLTVLFALGKLNGWFIFLHFEFLGILCWALWLIWDGCIVFYLSRAETRRAF